MYLEVGLIGKWLATLETIMTRWLTSLLFHLTFSLAFYGVLLHYKVSVTLASECPLSTSCCFIENMARSSLN